MYLTLDLLDVENQTIRVEIRARRDTVEIHYQNCLAGTEAREFVRDWLRRPRGEYAYDDVSWIAREAHPLAARIVQAIEGVLDAGHGNGSPTTPLSWPPIRA